MEEKLPPGFRFHPTDEELITYYLSRKVSNSSFTSRAISVVDLNKCEPWDLPAKATMGEKEWYFFSLRDRKYPTGLRTNRATEAGYWKTTGKDKEIFRGEALVGMKKTLVFYTGRAPKGEKSNWVMHEYRLDAKLAFKPAKDEWVVCRVFKKTAISKRPPQSPSSQPSLGSPSDTNANGNEYGDLDLTNLNHVSNIANSSSLYSGIQLHNNSYNPGMDSFNGDIDMSMTMNNWTAKQVASSLASPFPWPSNLLNPNLSTNLVLLKALQHVGLQSREMTSLAGYPPLMQQQQLLGNAFGAGYNSNPIGSSSSSSKVILDSTHQQEQQEQPYNWTPYDEHV